MRMVVMLVGAATVAFVASTATLEGQGGKEQLRARVEAMPGTANIKAFIASRMAIHIRLKRSPPFIGPMEKSRSRSSAS